MTHCPIETTMRLAAAHDSEPIRAIYAPYVRDTAITFECEVPSASAFSERVERIRAAYPYIVAERNGSVIGYAYAHECGERGAYQWNAELSVYLDQTATGGGIGMMLCETLIELLELQGVRNVFSLITVPNEPSVKLHERLGFAPCGVQVQTGYKLGSWHDVAWYQKQIGSKDCPRPIAPFSEVDPSLVADVLTRMSARAR